MALQFRFISTRKNKDVPFWWKSTEPAIKKYCADTLTIAGYLKIKHLYTESDDGLASVSTFFVQDMFQWNIFKEQMFSGIPGIFESRKKYFTDNQHSLRLKVLDEDIDEIVIENEIIS